MELGITGAIPFRDVRRERTDGTKVVPSAHPRSVEALHEYLRRDGLELVVAFLLRLPSPEGCLAFGPFGSPKVRGRPHGFIDERCGNLLELRPGRGELEVPVDTGLPEGTRGRNTRLESFASVSHSHGLSNLLLTSVEKSADGNMHKEKYTQEHATEPTSKHSRAA